MSFKSGHTLHQIIDDKMELTEPSWTTAHIPFQIGSQITKNMEWQYHDIMECIQYLISQKSFAKHMSWAPIQTFNSKHIRTYSELCTGTWWWETQVILIF